MSSKTTNIIRKSWCSCLQYYHIIISIVFHSAIWISRYDISTAQHMEPLYQDWFSYQAFLSRKFLIIMWISSIEWFNIETVQLKFYLIIYFIFTARSHLYHVGSWCFRNGDRASEINRPVPSPSRCQDWQHRLQTALRIQVKHFLEINLI